MSKLRAITRALSLVQTADLSTLQASWTESNSSQAPLLWHLVHLLSDTTAWLEDHLKLRSYTRQATLGWTSCAAHPDYSRLLMACKILLRLLIILQDVIGKLLSQTKIPEINQRKLDSAKLSLLVKPAFACYRLGFLLDTQKLSVHLSSYVERIQLQALRIFQSLPSFSTPTLLGKSLGSDILHHSLSLDSGLICNMLTKLLDSDSAALVYRSLLPISTRLCDFLVIKCDFESEATRGFVRKLLSHESRNLGLVYALVQAIRQRFTQSSITKKDDTIGDWRLYGCVRLLQELTPIGKEAILQVFPLDQLRAPLSSSRIASEILQQLQHVLTQFGDPAKPEQPQQKARELAPLLLMAQNVLRAGRASPVRREFASKRYNDQEFRSQRTAFSANARLPSTHVDTFVSTEPL